MLEFVRRFHNNKVCLQYLAKKRWGKKVICPHCSQRRIYHFKDGIRYKCSECKRIFNPKTSTIFHNTKIPMPKWFLACYLLTSHKKGVSSMQLAKDIDVSQKTAWRMLHKIRSMLTNDEILSGETVELDETFIGGKNRNKHYKDRKKGTQGRSLLTKSPVFGMVSRGHIVKAFHVPNLLPGTLGAIVHANIKIGSRILTDEYGVYPKILRGFRHEQCNHSAYHYVDGDIHTNALENFWSLLKRAILGIYHWVSRKYLQLYLNEACFRYNTQEMSGTERLDWILEAA